MDRMAYSERSDRSVSNTKGIDSYRIYRKKAEDTEYIRIDSTVVMEYLDDGLVPGRAYTYTITSFGDNGIESAPSSEFSVTPGVIAFLLNDNALYTSSRAVTLSFTVPEGIVDVLVGDDIAFTGSFYRSIESSGAWTLTDGDGRKTVYARFRSADGVESDVVTASIVLDTYAEIVSLTEDSNGMLLGPGAVLHIEMNTGEPGGAASVTIGTALLDAPLQYDTTSGTWKLAWTVTAGLDPQETVVAGVFLDRAGNNAPTALTLTTVSITDTSVVPEPVVLNEAEETASDWISLSWSRSEELDFSSYQIFRNEQPGVQGGGGDILIAVVTDRDQTSILDTQVEQDSATYYYRVFVKDSGGRAAGSNEVRASTRNSAPVTVGSFSAEATASPAKTVRLTWTAVDPSTVSDFAGYWIYRSTSEAVSLESDLVVTIGEIFTRNFLDENTDQATTYYYRIYVVDNGGLSTGSDAVSITTTDLDPSFITLAPPSVDQTNQNVSLTWTRCPDADFASYKIYTAESTQDNENPNFNLLDTINNQETSYYVHHPYVTALPFHVWYYMEVTDLAGRTTTSNTIHTFFEQEPPPSISSIIVLEGTRFAAINVSTDSPTSASAKYGESVSMNDGTVSSSVPGLALDHSITLDGLTPETVYYYQITVTNEAGITAYSQILSFTTTAESP